MCVVTAWVRRTSVLQGGGAEGESEGERQREKEKGIEKKGRSERKMKRNGERG